MSSLYLRIEKIDLEQNNRSFTRYINYDEMRGVYV